MSRFHLKKPEIINLNRLFYYNKVLPEKLNPG